jgi:predicted dehydrogenase
MLGFAGGAVGLIDLDSTVGMAVELQGTTGRLFIDPAEDGLTVWEYRDPPPPEGQRAWYQGRPCRERLTRHVPGGGGRGTLVAAVEELIGCIEAGPEGATRNRSSGEDGRAALEIGLAVYASHQQGGARVSLPLSSRDLTVASR